MYFNKNFSLICLSKKWPSSSILRFRRIGALSLKDDRLLEMINFSLKAGLAMRIDRSACKVGAYKLDCNQINNSFFSGNISKNKIVCKRRMALRSKILFSGEVFKENFTDVFYTNLEQIAFSLFPETRSSPHKQITPKMRSKDLKKLKNPLISLNIKIGDYLSSGDKIGEKSIDNGNSKKSFFKVQPVVKTLTKKNLGTKGAQANSAYLVCKSKQAKLAHVSPFGLPKVCVKGTCVRYMPRICTTNRCKASLLPVPCACAQPLASKMHGNANRRFVWATASLDLALFKLKNYRKNNKSQASLASVRRTDRLVLRTDASSSMIDHVPLRGKEGDASFRRNDRSFLRNDASKRMRSLQFPTLVAKLKQNRFVLSRRVADAAPFCKTRQTIHHPHPFGAKGDRSSLIMQVVAVRAPSGSYEARQEDARQHTNLTAYGAFWTKDRFVRGKELPCVRAPSCPYRARQLLAVPRRGQEMHGNYLLCPVVAPTGHARRCTASRGTHFARRAQRLASTQLNAQVSFKVKRPVVLTSSGRVVMISKTQLVIQKTQPVLFYDSANLHVKKGELVSQGAPILTLTHQTLITGDIVQGIPRIEQLFEAFTSPQKGLKDRRRLNAHDTLHSQVRDIFRKNWLKNVLSIAVRKSLEEIQSILLELIQKVYLSQGVLISDKHIEIIIRQMTSKGQVLDSGSTGLLLEEVLPIRQIENANITTPGKKCLYVPSVVGLTAAALTCDSFISAASFQETTRVLSRDAIVGKSDFLRGLKEKVVIGDLISAGTGLEIYFIYTLFSNFCFSRNYQK